MASLTININLTLAPGKTVTIDSENYRVYQDATDLTDNISGSWIDEITRKTQSIQITPNRSAVSAEITYKERYL